MKKNFDARRFNGKEESIRVRRKELMFSPDEWAEIEREANKKHISVSNYLRLKIFQPSTT